MIKDEGIFPTPVTHTMQPHFIGRLQQWAHKDTNGTTKTTFRCRECAGEFPATEQTLKGEVYYGGQAFTDCPHCVLREVKAKRQGNENLAKELNNWGAF